MDSIEQSLQTADASAPSSPTMDLDLQLSRASGNASDSVLNLKIRNAAYQHSGLRYRNLPAEIRIMIWYLVVQATVIVHQNLYPDQPYYPEAIKAGLARDDYVYLSGHDKEFIRK